MADGPSPLTSETASEASLPQPLAKLEYRSPENARGQTTTYYVLGTAHVSKQSCLDAETLIAQIRPQVVLLELCAERRALLAEQQVREPDFGAALSDIRSGKATPFQAIYAWLLSKVASNLEIMPGEEFRAALRAAGSIGAQVVLGDRPLSVTLARVWGSLSLWEKTRLVTHLSWAGFGSMDAETMKEEIESMKDTDALTEAILEFGKTFPGMVRPLLVERDLYMIYMLRRLAPGATRVVAVVGAGHLQGIRERWEEPIDIQALMEVPEKRPLRRRLVKLGLAAGSTLVVVLLLRAVIRRRR